MLNGFEELHIAFNVISTSSEARLTMMLLIADLACIKASYFSHEALILMEAKKAFMLDELSSLEAQLLALDGEDTHKKIAKAFLDYYAKLKAHEELILTQAEILRQKLIRDLA